MFKGLFKGFFITGRNKVVAKVIFLHLSVILFTGGACLSACWDAHPPGADTPQEQTPPGADTTPPEQSPPREQTPQEQTQPPGSRHPSGSRLRYTVYERPVRILLECILVLFVHLVRFVALNLGITWLTIPLALYFCEKVVYDFTL